MAGAAKSGSGSERREFIPWAKPVFWGLEKQYVNEALDSTWISGGPFVDRLEKQIEQYCASPFALACCNGTAAIHLIYLGLGLQPGDEIIVPAFCFQACANIALHLGMNPVFAEVEADTWCLSARAIERCITPRTRLIAAVHTYGNLCDMDGILELGKERGIAVMEDAAESFASTWASKRAGAIAQIGSLSFQATKTIATGEGGMVLTANPAWAERMKLYRSHGMAQRRYWHEVPGHNFRLTNMQAALGCAQFENLEQIVSHRRQMHARYRQRLENMPGITPQRFGPQVEPVLWAMAVLLDSGAYPQGRDAVMQTLGHAGIETRPGFYSPCDMPIFQARDLPVSQQISRQVISLPSYPTLSEEQIAFICDALAEARH